MLSEEVVKKRIKRSVYSKRDKKVEKKSEKIEANELPARKEQINSFAEIIVNYLLKNEGL